MKEIEVKVLDIDKDQIVAKLNSIGAKKIDDSKVISKYFDYEDKRLLENGNSLRLSKQGEKVFLTMKGKQSHSYLKIREEDEVLVDDYDKILLILKSLGLHEIKHQEKYRESYKFKDIKFEIDTYPELPTFLEVEAPTEERIKEGLTLLGFSLKESTNKSAHDILREHGIVHDNIRIKEE